MPRKRDQRLGQGAKTRRATSGTARASGDRRARRRSRAWRGLLLLLVLLLAAVVMIRSAWVCDDAYITFRVCENLCRGYGLRYNVSQRVWVYTNPLLMLCMSVLYLVTGEFFYTVIFLSLIVSMAAVAVVSIGLARGALMTVCAVGLLMTSKAFVDYTTSGLENCLGYLLLAGFYWLALRKDVRSSAVLFGMALAAGLATLNRMDTVLLCLPVLAWAWWQRRSIRRLLVLVAGFIPFVAWEVFALIYYGTLVPNTALAKVSTGLPISFYLKQGVAYYANSLLLDPITLPVILAALVAGFACRRGRTISAALGVLLYLLYVLRVGDFMSGRLFAVPMLCAVAVLCVADAGGPRWFRGGAKAGALLAIALVSLLHPLSPLRSGRDYSIRIMKGQDHNVSAGICDERAFYYPTNGLLTARRHPAVGAPAHLWAVVGFNTRRFPKRVFVWGVIGMAGFQAGPTAHIVDRPALVDPLLARLPARRDKPHRIGHIDRFVPRGYVQTLRTGRNCIEDPRLAQLYEAIYRVTSGPIWSVRRYKDIWKLNTGQYDQLIDVEFYRDPEGRPAVQP